MALISVVMPVYNGQRFLRAAVDGILNQTFTDFQFVIIDDASTDATRAILDGYTDPRIQRIHNQKNLGAYISRNKGLAFAKGKYIAFMDADDISLPHRLERQFHYLEQNPEIGILGSQCQMIDADGQNVGVYCVPVDDLQIRWGCLLANPFAAPTVVLRRDIINLNRLSFDESFEVAGDYDLWARILRHTRGANLLEPFVKYRIGVGMTNAQRRTQLENHDLIALRIIREWLSGFEITPAQINQLRALFVGGNSFVSDDLEPLTVLLRLYLDMFLAFREQFRKETGIKALQREEALKLARRFHHPPFQMEWLRLMGRLVAMWLGAPFVNDGR